jgi:integrase
MASNRGQILPRNYGFLVRVFLGRDATTGKRLYNNEQVRSTKKKDAEKVLTAMLRKIDTGELLHEPTRMSVKEYLEHWLETAARQKLTARTLDDYEGVLRRYVYPALGLYRLTKLAPVDVQTLYTKMLVPKLRGGMGLTPRTVINTHRVFSSAVKQAVKWRMLSQNVCHYADLPKSQPQEMHALSESESERFLEAAKGDRCYVLFAVMLGTGLRPGEALALMWKDFDPIKGTMTVQRATETLKGRTTFKPPKTPKSRRSIKLPEHLTSLLLEYEAASPIKSALTFPSTKGTPLNERNVVLRHFKPLLSKADLPHEVRLYDLRHTHATLLLKAGVHIKIVSERLGHSSIALTADTYSHVLPGMQDEAASKLNAMLFKGTSTGTGNAYN